MKKVIITGATGFLGKNLVYTLLERNVEVTVVVRDIGRLPDLYSTFPSCAACRLGEHVDLQAMESGYFPSKQLRIIKAELSDYHMLDRHIPVGCYDVFYHFAWAGTSGKEREDALLQLANVKAVCAAVGAAKRLGCQKFVNAGSLMEYEAMKCMQEQGIVPGGNYMYRSAKLAAHYMAKAEAGRIGMPFINMIISNVYGEGEVSVRLISSVLQKLIKGENVSYTAGTQLYDFIHIADAAEAFYQVGENGRHYCDYYIGSGQIRPLREYIEELYACLPVRQTPVFGDVPHDGVQLSYKEFDKEALFRDTGFQCRVSFKEGIKRTYGWLKEDAYAKF